MLLVGPAVPRAPGGGLTPSRRTHRGSLLVAPESAGVLSGSLLSRLAVPAALAPGAGPPCIRVTPTGRSRTPNPTNPSYCSPKLAGPSPTGSLK
ncbi:hypothetical protein KJK32_37590 [Streptomyces sp. JCM17656]|nr:hypothetical protein KJK32_37590 [Streptomyces sp. JCM17656]